MDVYQKSASYGNKNLKLPTKKSTLYLVCFRTEEKEIERNSSDHVYEEPTLEVVNRYLSRMAHHLIVFIYICSPKVDEYVNDEHDVHYEVYDIEWVIVTTRTAIVGSRVLMRVRWVGKRPRKGWIWPCRWPV